MQDLEFLEGLAAADLEATPIEGGQTNLVVTIGKTQILDLPLTGSPFGGTIARFLAGIFGPVVPVTPRTSPVTVAFKFVY